MLLMFAFMVSGCNKSEQVNQSLSVHLNWTTDVTLIDMAAFGLKSSEISQNKTYELLPGEGIVYWESAGVEYSKKMTVSTSGIRDAENDLECEQEGENEGENEACVFSFSFSGDALSISKP